VVVGTLATGIAVATLVFGLINAILYRIYDRYPKPRQLVLLLEENPRLGTGSLTSARAVREWRSLARSFQQIGGLEARRVTLTGRGDPRSVFLLGVTEDVLPMLGARAAAGRLFAASEYQPGAPPVAMIGHGLWQRLGGDRGVVGGAITIDGHSFTVVGVLAQAFTVLPFFGNEPDLVTPLAPSPAGSRAARTVLAVGRLRQDVALEQASAEMRAIAAAAARSDPAARDWQVWLKPARGLDPKGDAGFIVALVAGVGFILLIVCSNVTNLLLARAAGRTRELATRLALGASRSRLARQLMTETLLLAAAGGAAGLVVSYWACRAVSWLIAGTNLGVIDFSLDARTVVFAAAISAAAALTAGLVPAIRAARMPVVAGLKEGRLSSSAASPERLRQLLVGVEVALAVALLVGSGLVLRGLARMRQNDPGFRPDGLSVLTVTLSGDRYARAQARTGYVEEALGRLGRPGSVEAAAANFVPAAGAELPREPLEIDGQAASSDVAPSAGVISADPSFFRTMGIPLKRGRFFDASDRENSLPVAIVDEKTVEKWFGQKDPIGARVRIVGDVRAVVGVVGSVRAFHLNVAPAPIVYLPYGQRPSAAVAFVLRTGTDASGAVALARRELAAVDRDQVVRGGDAYAALIARSLGGFNLSSALAVVLAAIALAVSAVGLYSVMSFWVVRRTRETAIRIALGASPRRVVAEIVARGLRLTAGGATVGFMLALVVGKLLSFRLRQVQAFDPVLLGAVLLIVLAVAVIASILPARRAAALDPMAAIRTE